MEYQDTESLRSQFPMTHIHPDARIAHGVTIEPFVTIQGDVVIGEGCHIMANAVINDGARIGNHTRIFPGAVISTIPQDLKYSGEYTTCEIGNNCTIREFATINRGTQHSGRTIIGNDVLVMAYAHVAHDCIIGDHAILANASNLAGHVEVGSHAIIGGMCGIHQFVHIGEHAFLQGGSKVGKDIPPFIIAGRVPVRYTGINSVGLRRRGFTADDLALLREVYRPIFMEGKSLTNAIAYIEEHIAESEIRNTILDFVRASTRGLIKGQGGEEE